ncbi:MAG: citrate transporter [Lachnospiraceae bacterium]|jgi:type III secretion system FlhB-like substrate exporter|nr:citrate transporter [Lachnospiraceae bacterium]
MLELTTTLTPLHILYLTGVIVILFVMIMRRDTPIVCILFLFLLGLTATGTLFGGIQTVFSASLYAAKEFMEIIATIALITALSKCLSDLGSDYLMMKPLSKIMCSSSVTWWILGITMLLFSLFLWPSPSVALVGAIMLPLVIKKGLNPLAAAMAMNLFGHGIALSYDFVIQGAPAISASAAGISTEEILTKGTPLFITMGAATVITAFLLNHKSMDKEPADLHDSVHSSGAEENNSSQNPGPPSKAALFLAVFTPLAFFGDILLMLLFGLKGGDATSLVSGTATLLMVLGAVLGFSFQAPEKVTDYLTHGFLFAIRIFAPVILIGAFFFMGGEGITSILGEHYQNGIMNDWAIWLAGKAPLNRYMAAALQMVIGTLTGLDGSGFSGLPLTGALSRTFSLITGGSVPVFAALGQITAIFTGGGTLVPWGIIPVAAICNVSPTELARKNLIPVLVGFGCTFVAACVLI